MRPTAGDHPGGNHRLLQALLAALAWTAGCAAPVSYTRCLSDDECPATHACDVERNVCAARTVVDASVRDVAALDVVATDLGAVDSVGADSAGADSAGADATGVDVLASDAPAGDGAGLDAASADASADASVGNQPPQVAIVQSPAIYPGTSISWLGSASDPDGAAGDLIIDWQLIDPPAGVFMDLDAVDPLRPLFGVTRLLYVAGPEDLSLTVRLNVTDVDGATVSTEAPLLVLDERGPYVDVTSPWQGTGYDATDTAHHGYCGAPGHACREIQDGIDNLLHAQLHDGLWTDVHEVRVASTGTYSVVGPIHLGGNALSCGWNASFTARRGSIARSRIEFTGDMGVQVGVSTAIDGCEIVGVEPLSEVGAARMAVSGVDVGLVFKDSRAVGSATAGPVSDWALGLDLVWSGQVGSFNIEDSQIEGGIATTAAVGLNLSGSRVRVARSVLSGGQAAIVIGAQLDLVTAVGAERSVIEASNFDGGEPTEIAKSSAVGLSIGGGNPIVRNGCTITGGSRGATVVGLAIGASATGVHLSDSDVVALPSGSPSLVYGALVQSSLTSERSSYRGGNGSFSVGLFAEAGLPSGTVVTLTDDVIVGGDNPAVAVGLAVGAGVQATVLRGSLRGSADNSTASYADALVLGASSAVDATDASLSSGRALERARGAALDEAGASLELTNCTVEAGSTGRAAGVVLGIDHVGGSLSVTGGSVTALDGDASSRGLRVAAPAVLTLLDGTNVAAGNAMGNLGTALGIEHSSGSLTLRADATGDAISVAAGNATLESVGVHVEASPATSVGLFHLIENVQIHSAQAASSTGLRLVQPGTTRVAGCTVQAGTALVSRSAGAVIDTGASITIETCTLEAGTGKTVSAGLWTEFDCEACRIQRNTVRGGPISDNVGASFGMRLARRAQDGQPTFVYSNLVVAGAAQAAYGVAVGGAGGSVLRILHNTIDGGGRSSGVSIGVLLGDVILSGAPNRVAALVGNIIGAGRGTSSYNIFENGTCQTTGSRWAEPVQLVGGRNNNLYPAGTIALLHDFHARSVASCEDDVLDLSAVNAIDPYQADGMVVNDRTHAVNPMLLADGVHLDNGSPVVDLVYRMDTWWPAASMGAMLDFDGEPREMGARGDIGADELQ